jgi:L-amino acid N-acyltransferase YncA
MSISEAYSRYVSSKTEGEKYVYKVVKRRGSTVAVLFLCLFKEEGKTIMSINPICVDPRLQNQGIGSAVLRDLLQRCDVIVGEKVDEIRACVDLENFISKQLFLKAGFTETGKSENGKFVYLQWKTISAKTQCK